MLKGLKVDNKFICDFVIGLVNRFIVLTDNFLKLQSGCKQGLILGDAGSEYLPLKKGKKEGNLLQYFVEAFRQAQEAKESKGESAEEGKKRL